MNDIKFNSLNELYTRLLPALNTKVNELKLNGISYIKVDDIWDYLRMHKWNKSSNLTLSECVDDILNTSDLEYKKYMKNKMSSILGG
ncbi:MAG: hypothetical protein IJD92_03785 [Bacilli bacterium]|nr:hypothetical protein [Bacilli bacterium]